MGAGIDELTVGGFRKSSRRGGKGNWRVDHVVIQDWDRPGRLYPSWLVVMPSVMARNIYVNFIKNAPNHPAIGPTGSKLQHIMDAAVEVWADIIFDNHNMTIHFFWVPDIDGALADALDADFSRIRVGRQGFTEKGIMIFYQVNLGDELWKGIVLIVPELSGLYLFGAICMRGTRRATRCGSARLGLPG